MQVRKGSKVGYKVGRYYAVGKVLSVAEGKATLETTGGAVVKRDVTKLVAATEPKEESPKKVKAPVAPKQQEIEPPLTEGDEDFLDDEDHERA